MKSFETVWKTINEKYFDPTFNGLDWSEVHDRYQPKITAAQNEEEYYLLINKMLFELNVSHIGVVPPNDLGQIEPILSAEGNIGIDVRIIEDNAVITSVKSDTPGDQAGLKPGYIIKRIDGIKIEQLSDIKHINEIDYRSIDKETFKIFKVLAPPYNKRNRKRQITQSILEKIYGLPDATVSIEFMDDNGDTQKK